MSTIKNGSKFPKAVKMAVLKAIKAKANKARSMKDIADDFGVSKGTACVWKRKAGLSKPQPPQLVAYQKAQAATRAYNTPTVVDYTTAAGSTAQGISLKGVIYKL